MIRNDEAFDRFVGIVNSGKYEAFASVLMDKDNPMAFYEALHEFLVRASNDNTRYDLMPEGNKFCTLVAFTDNRG